MKKGKEKFLFLLENEIKSSWKFFVITVIGTFIFNISIHLFRVNNVLKSLKYNNSLDYLNSQGKVSFIVVIYRNFPYYLFPIVVTALLLFIFVITLWLRDYYGNTRTIYTSLTLPTSRMIIIISKLITAIAMAYLFISTQILAYIIDNFIFNLVIPKDVLTKVSIIDIFSNIIGLKVPILTFRVVDNLVILLMAISGIMILFTGILLERSFKLKGVIICIATWVIWALIYFMVPAKLNLYSDEYLIYQLVVYIGSTIINLWLCNYLLKNKVSI